MKKDKKIIISLLFVIVILLTTLFYILNTEYQIEINGITYKQKILYYIIGLD